MAGRTKAWTEDYESMHLKVVTQRRRRAHAGSPAEKNIPSMKFDNVSVAFSGGKDSTVVLNLSLAFCPETRSGG